MGFSAKVVRSDALTIAISDQGFNEAHIYASTTSYNNGYATVNVISSASNFTFTQGANLYGLGLSSSTNTALIDWAAPGGYSKYGGFYDGFTGVDEYFVLKALFTSIGCAA